MNTLVLIFDALLFFFVVALLVDFVSKTLGEESKLLDGIISLIKKVYGYIRQRFCKKGTEINADGGTIQNNADIYDSSSVWED